MKREQKICFDKDLQIEAYLLQGFSQTFPNHFHEHYVLGMVENGEREMICGSGTYKIVPGDFILLHPGENHQCKPIGESLLIYKALNISEECMKKGMKELTGREFLPVFQKNIFHEEEIRCIFLNLHQMVMEQSKEFEKEEIFLLLMELLLKKDTKLEKCDKYITENMDFVENICDFINKNFTRNLMLEDICRYAGVSKSTLLRIFTGEKGITPYRYLETVRVNQAKKMLEQGMTSAETALRAGFSDQSHFTKYFQRFTGITPGAYQRIFTGEREKDEK